MTKGFNINDYIWVQLTEAGQQFLLGSHAAVLKDAGNGYHRVQLWEWMALVGPRTYNGMPAAFTVDNEIHFTDPSAPTGNHFGRVMGEMSPELKPLIDAMELDAAEFAASFQREREDSRARVERRRVAMGFPPRPPEDW